MFDDYEEEDYQEYIYDEQVEEARKEAFNLLSPFEKLLIYKTETVNQLVNGEQCKVCINTKKPQCHGGCYFYFLVKAEEAKCELFD